MYLGEAHPLLLVVVVVTSTLGSGGRRFQDEAVLVMLGCSGSCNAVINGDVALVVIYVVVLLLEW